MGAQGDQNAAPVILNVDNDEGAVEVPAAKGPTRQRQVSISQLQHDPSKTF